MMGNMYYFKMEVKIFIIDLRFDGDYRIDKIPTFRLEYDMIEI